MSQPAEDAVTAAQQSIVRDVLRWALPALATVTLIAIVVGVVTGTFAQSPARLVNSFALLGVVTLSGALLWRKRYRLAVGTLMAGVIVVVLTALTMNGGLRSPSTMLMLFLISLSGWLYGGRAATVAALLSLAAAALFLALGLAGVLPDAPLLPLPGAFMMVVVSVALMWTTSHGPPARMREALVAATQRQLELEAEQARRHEAAHQFRAVFDQSPHLMALLHPDGRIFAINRTALEFVGLASEAGVIGVHFAKSPWWSHGDKDRLLAGATEIAAGRAVRFDTERVDRNGQTRHFEFTLSPFLNAAGALAYFIAEGRDVTDLALMKERRERTARLELVGQLAGGVAHDFNNVLMAIVSSAEVLRLELEEDGHLSPDVIESLDTILNAGKRAGDLTTRLLTVGRRVATEKRPLSMTQVVISAVKLLERTLPPTIRVSFTPGGEADLVDGDAASLESALINLAVNARDAMPDGGTLTFSTERVELDADWCRTSGFDLTAGPHVRVSVRDTGVGIAPENVARVFEPFFTTKDEGKGTGLGLASVFGVMREHRGAVHLYSEPGKGTVFHLSLPISTHAPRRPSKAHELRRWDSLRALVVDDEDAIRTVLPRLLSRLGISSVAASSAEAAAPHLGERFDLLITDIVLPGRRGNELAMEYLARNPTGRALLISGFSKGAELSSLPPERTRVLTKPFAFEALQTALHELLDGR